jgi:hypothetical protein
MGKWILVLAIAAMTSAGAATFLWQELREERTRTTELQTQLEQAQRPSPSSAAPTDSKPVELQAQTQTQQLPAAPPPSPPPTTPAFVAASGGFAIAPSGRPQAMDPEMRRRLIANREQQQRMLQDPEYRDLMRSQHKLGLRQAYGDLEPLLGLTSEEADRLLDVLAEQALRAMEGPIMLPSFDGTPPGEAQRREQQRHFDAQRRQHEAEIAAVLGAKSGAWQEYQNNGWSRSQVSRLRTTLASTDEPLRQDQLKPLVDALAAEQKTFMDAQRAFAHAAPQDPQSFIRLAEKRFELTVESQERTRAALSGLLSPSQLELLRQQQQQELKMQELGLRQQRARAEAQARGELPPDVIYPMPAMREAIVVDSP